MTAFEYTYLILTFPFFFFLLLGLFGKRFAKLSGILGTTGIGISALLSVWLAYKYFFHFGFFDGVYHSYFHRYTWLQFSPSLSIDMGIMLDPISIMMLVVITIVSFMVHLYSIGYMHGEERYATYYSFLSLFTFSMIGLVVSVNIFQMYIFWELVGVSSFLLVGFYFTRPSAVAAAKKAFIVTRFADLGFLIGILVLSFYSESLDFQTIINHMMDYNGSIFLEANTVSFLGLSALTWALSLIFIGGAGKSAMFPLHIWLPDAMEGPTPVSALIHAATMVVAGVFLVARLFPVYAQIPIALDLVMYVGAFSALFAAIIACTQTDIKRILAYSTMSQIGYMMFALGVSGYWGNEGLGYTASMFHLFTHAFFKALLFLGAGVVIHYVHSNEISNMGGLGKKMPLTHAVFLIACLAISGIPPLSGFFSKEEILTAAFAHHKMVYVVGLLTAGITAFYMFRLYFMVFWNKPFVSQGNNQHVENMSDKKHGEIPVTMQIPIVCLALATLVTGWIPFSNYISADRSRFETEIHGLLTMAAISIAVLGILIAAVLYLKRNSKPDVISYSLGNFFRTVYNKFYIDEIYLFVTKKIIFNLIAALAAWFDRTIVDQFMNTLSVATENVSEGIKTMQSGKIADYVFWFFIGAIGLAIYVVM